MHWILDAVCVFLVSLTLAGIIIPQILLISFRKKLFDEPDERKIHKAAVPRLGGIAFMPAILFSMALVAGVETIVMTAGGRMMHAEGIHGINFASCSPTTLPLSFGLCALIMMYLVGIADDLIGVKYRAKFVAQILAGLFIAAAGVRLDNLQGFMGIHELPAAASWGLTVLIIVFVTNAVNLIDGIDGLASGLSGIAMLFYGLAFLSMGRPFYAILAFAGLGTLVPFFYYNVFGKPAMGKKIFMGDTGSLTIGIILAFLAITMTKGIGAGGTRSDIIVIAFAPLAIPCLDVVRVFFHRIIRGKSPFLPDKVHIHHKLLAIGFRQRPAMITILATSSALIAVDLWLSLYINSFLVLLADMVLWVAGNYLLTRAITARQKRLNITDGYC
ncbi:MAG: undecaprenyl/decaprenyl-phosphate alpha-N-acetylglucosaminyl 1-phosphate transferase [Muribaculaceae bacterium]|nr:undecaprenyl/decaprenyl-phosphate alpha-N-acetylglucosaminyl 1-phosphate transferase [Muribaculaceae bacterium]